MSADSVLRLSALPSGALSRVLAEHGLTVVMLRAGSAIPGSFWGEPEAGLVRSTLFVRPDTPVHSALHEACHWLCATPDRRAHLHTDAGGSDAEEDAVCYLQILLADALPGVGRARMLIDMDRWGYSFRLGSARAWFEQDAVEARDWLTARALIPAAASAPMPHAA